MNKFFEFFQEDNGGFSMARLIVFMMAALYFIQGVSQIIRVGQMTMNWQDIASVLGPFLIKAGQKKFEEKEIRQDGQDKTG
jgi:hypothetical protein